MASLAPMSPAAKLALEKQRVAEHNNRVNERIKVIQRAIKEKEQVIQDQQTAIKEKSKQIGDLQMQKLLAVVAETVAAKTPSDPVAKNTNDRGRACRNDSQYSAALDQEIAKFRKNLVDLRNTVAEVLNKGAAKTTFAGEVTAAWANATELPIETKEAEVERLKEEIRALAEAAMKHLSIVTRPVKPDDYVPEPESPPRGRGSPTREPPSRSRESPAHGPASMEPAAAGESAAVPLSDTTSGDGSSPPPQPEAVVVI